MPDNTQDDNEGSVSLLAGGEIRKQSTSVDPNLQRLAAKSAPNEEAQTAITPLNTPLAFATDGPSTVVNVIGRLEDPALDVPGLTVVRTVGDIFTGTASARDLEAILQHENVLSLELPKPILPTLSVSVSEVQALPDQIQDMLPDGATVPDGDGVIVGIIDYGCDVVHDNFRNADGSTRILCLWDQQGGFDPVRSPNGYFYGREFDAAAIDAALGTPDPYATLSYDPGFEAHGTHVMDIAAGNGRATGNPGVAPNADIIFVDLNAAVVGQDRTFGDARALMDAAEYIFVKAAELGKSAVINISSGTHGGPHDGSTNVERWLDALLSEPNRAIVLSAGNARGHAGHASGAVQPGSPVTLSWIIKADDPSANELEIWYAGHHRLEVALIEPGGYRHAGVPRGHSQPLSIGLSEVISIIHNEHVEDNGDNQISILLNEALSETSDTVWQVELKAIGPDPVPFHAWIERDDLPDRQQQSVLDSAEVDLSYTLSSIACGEHTIAVGSYMAGESDRLISSFSSEGPTRDGKLKPEISAPGQNLASPPSAVGVLAAASRTNGAVRMSGTSMAAPHVAGLIALVMQTAQEPLTNAEIRQTLTNTARHAPPPNAINWDPMYGFGRVNGAAFIEAFQQQDVAPVP